MTAVRRASLLLVSICAGTLVCAESDFLVRGVKIVAPDSAFLVAEGTGMGVAATGRGSVAPVEFFLPETQAPFSVVMLPGGGLSSWSYTETPDGREGWAQLFARAGIAVYLLNPPSGRRSQLGRWNRESVWSLWGFGPEPGIPYGDAKFPLTAIETLEDSFYIARSRGGPAHISTLLSEIGPAYVLGHSAGGRAMFAIASAGHENLLGTISIETTGCPSDADQLTKTYVDGGRRFLSVWGDNLDRGAPNMRDRYRSCQRASDLLRDAGGDARTIRLKEDLGVGGNSHLMMQDTNSDEIAALLINWMTGGRPE